MDITRKYIKQKSQREGFPLKKLPSRISKCESSTEALQRKAHTNERVVAGTSKYHSDNRKASDSLEELLKL